MNKKLGNESEQYILTRQIESIFSVYSKQLIDRGYWTNEPADIAALTAVEVLSSYCRSIDKRHCCECVFYNEANMCGLFSKIQTKTNKEML